MSVLINTTLCKMPLYTYKNPKSGDLIDVIQKMNDKHEYVDVDGVVYERVFESLNLSKDQSIDAFSEKDFARKTRDKNYNLGEMWDASKELSEKRKSVTGKDEIKEKNLINKYEKRTRNIKKNSSKKISS